MANDADFSIFIYLKYQKSTPDTRASPTIQPTTIPATALPLSLEGTTGAGGAGGVVVLVGAAEVTADEVAVKVSLGTVNEKMFSSLLFGQPTRGEFAVAPPVALLQFKSALICSLLRHSTLNWNTDVPPMTL